VQQLSHHVENLMAKHPGSHADTRLYDTSSKQRWTDSTAMIKGRAPQLSH
jgi:hypothetical protein